MRARVGIYSREDGFPIENLRNQVWGDHGDRVTPGFDRPPLPEVPMLRRFHSGSVMQPVARSTSMASLTLKGIPDDLLTRLRRVAETNRRSLNREVIERLERSVEGRRLDPDSLLARADALRARLALAPMDDASIRRAKRAGRA